MDMSEFNVIFRMDWLAAHRVVIDCDHDDVCVMFQGDKHDAMPQVVYNSRWHG